MYPLIVDEGEAVLLEQDSKRRAEVFEQALLDEPRLGMELADERLAASGTRAYVIPGNDDPWSIDEVLESGESVVPCRRDRRSPRDGLTRLLEPHPWKTPRELDEEEIYLRLRRLADQLENPERAIFNIHVPPWESSLDTAFEVDEELR